MTSREILTANRTYYVAPTGNDSNTGLTPSDPLLTPQRAADIVARSVDMAGFDVTVQAADGTYNAGVLMRGSLVSGGGRLYFVGNKATPANCFVDTVGDDFSAYDGAFFEARGFKTRTRTSGRHIFASEAHIRFGEWDFGPCAATHIEVSPAGLIEGFASYTISGGAVAHGHTPMVGGNIILASDGNPITVTLIGTPAFSAYFFGTAGGKITSHFNLVSFLGPAIGVRGYAHTHGILDAGGQSARNYFPGNANIIERSGGIYIGFESSFPACLASELPPASSCLFNSYIVYDSSVTTIGAAVAGGGGAYVRVTSNASVWKVQEVIN